MASSTSIGLARLAAATGFVIALVPAVLVPATAGADPDGDSAYNGAPTVVSGGPVPTRNGVPCVGGHLGACTGFAQNMPTRPRA